MSNINCKIMQELLPLYLDQVLDPDVEREVSAHIQNCETCRQIYDQVKADQLQIIEQDHRHVNYLKKYRRRLKGLCWALGSVIALFLLLAACTHYLIWGSRVTVSGRENYAALDAKGIQSPLAVFPSPELEIESGDFYYRLQDEIFAPVCQIYLKNVYTEETFYKEIERLEALELTYQGQTNRLYVDNEHYADTAYVALANWTDRFEYAIAFENLHTIVYVYLQNMDAADLHMDQLFLPAYFTDNNAVSYPQDSMSEEHRSYYSFKIGNSYIDCMDLAP
ncbi:MAG: zf-HC2 domain-containing protein [Candidatus Gastranaerophilales bacterium]|nr:zf-HC2 domain-containing protein [Candidatus Gastranaerophilales bacterium]